MGILVKLTHSERRNERVLSMVPKRVKKVIKLYQKDLEKKVSIKKIILFGSYAKGKVNKDSDIDLVVLSDDFAKMNPDRRLDLLQRERRNPQTWKFAMDIFGYTPEEYAQASSLTTLGEIKETGIVI